MAWPYSKQVISTDDQTEFSGTNETIRKDRILQKFSRLRWEKPLRDELEKLRTGKILSEKNYIFEKHRYEAKLKDFKGIRNTSVGKACVSNTRKDVNLNLHKKDVKRRMNNFMVDELPDPVSFLPRKNLKWSLNDTAERIPTKQQELTRGKNTSNELKRGKLPSIYDQLLNDKGKKNMKKI